MDQATFHTRIKGEPMNRTLSRRFKRDYDRLFREDPLGANMLLLLAEMANERGEIRFNTPDPVDEIYPLMKARFEDLRAYQLPGGPKR